MIKIDAHYSIFSFETWITDKWACENDLKESALNWRQRDATGRFPSLTNQTGFRMTRVLYMGRSYYILLSVGFKLASSVWRALWEAGYRKNLQSQTQLCCSNHSCNPRKTISRFVESTATQQTIVMHAIKSLIASIQSCLHFSFYTSSNRAICRKIVNQQLQGRARKMYRSNFHSPRFVLC